LKIENDQRKKYLIENFGFEAGGQLHMTILNFKVGGKEYTNEYQGKVGFVIRKTEVDTTTFVDDGSTDTPTNNAECLTNELSGLYDVAVNINSTNNGVLTEKILEVQEGQEGFYNTIFVSCLTEPVSYELKLVQFNLDDKGKKNFLSAGYAPLPALYGVFTGVYGVCLLIWVAYFMRTPNAKVNRIHHLMTLMIVLKLLSLLFQTIEQNYVMKHGTGEGWRIVYYIFAGLKGIMLFVLIALLGTGWSFIKPFLSDKDKKIFLVVIPLQILDNIALIIIEESAPGSQEWFTWKDIFRLVDIICCGAILIPIIWSIKHLREASQIDGKAALNMRKLKLFRQFYLMVVAYIYFTRIIVYLVDATLPFRMVWLGDFFTELATLAFFIATGYKFRPAADNPYFMLGEEEAAGEQIEL